MGKNNSYDLLRLIFCVFVIITHCTYITGIHNPLDIDTLSHNQTNLGEIGVMGFFSLSGFLITGSFLRTNFLKFSFNRIIRIFPGFWFCLFITAFLIAPLIYYAEYHTLKNLNLFQGYGSYTYVRLNFFTHIKQAEIANVLDKSKVHNINGSLWSLFYELLCYLLTLVIGLLGMLNKYKKFYLFAFFAVYLYYVYYRLTSAPPEYFKLFISYLCGSIFYLFSKQLTLSNKGVLVLSVTFIMLLFIGYIHEVMPVLITLICLSLFSKFSVKMPLDISYGMYIYGFPIQQLLNSAIRHLNPFIFLVLSLAITFVFAVISFVGIERPFMRIKKYIN